MADIKKTILLELGINKNQFLEEAAQTQKQITELSERQKLLKTTGQEGSIEYQNNVSNLKLLKQEYAEAQKSATNFEKALKEGNDEGFGSLNQLNAELSVLTAEFKKLSEVGRENSEEGKAIAEATAAVTAKLSEQEQAVGNFRRNVGNYPKQIVEITQKIKELNVTTEKADFGSSEFQAAAGAIKIMQGQLDKLIDEADKVPGSINEIKETINALQQIKLNVPIEEVQKYNDKILELETNLLKAEGKIDQFGDKEPKNKVKKSFDDLNDVIQGTIAVTTAATILGADQARLEEIVAKATAANAIATNAKAIAKGAVVAWEQAEFLATKANIAVQVAYALVVGTSTGAMKLFRIALASTGVGAIVILIGLLIANFSSVTKAVKNFVEGNTVLKAVINAILLPIRLLWTGLEKVGEALGILSTEQEIARDKLIAGTNDSIAAIEKQHDREIALVRATGKEVFAIEREKLKAVLERCEQSIVALIAKKKAEGDLGEEELKQLQELEEKKLDLQNDIRVSELEEQKKRDDEAKKLSDDAKKKADDAAKKAQEERKKRAEEIKNFNKDLADMEFELNQKHKSAYDADLAALDKKYVELQAKAKGNTDQLRKIELLKNKEFAELTDKYNKIEIAKQVELTKQMNDLYVQRINQKLSSVGEDYALEYDLKVQLISKQREMELAQENLTETQKLAIAENYRFQERQAVDEFLKGIEKKREEQDAKELAAAQKKAELDKNDPTKSIDEKFASQQLALDMERDQAIQAAIAKGEAIDEIEREYSQRSLQLQRDKDAAESEMRKTFIDSMSATTDSLGDLLGKQSTLYKAAFKARQIATVADIVIGTQKEISGIFASYSTLGPFGQVLAIAKAIGAGIRGAASIAQVKAQQFASGGIFWSKNSGGMVYGPGTGTSDSVNARLSNGESVINANSTRLFGPMLSAINVAGGGRPFHTAINYSMPALASGGVFDGGYSVNYQTPVIDAGEIGDAVGKSLVQNFPEVWVNIDDVNNAQSKKANVEERVSF